MRILIAIHLSAVFLLLAGCSYYIDKSLSDEGTSQGAAGKGQAQITYKTIHERIFAPRCVSCHGSAGSVNLENYEQVKTHISSIYQTTIVTKTMPKGSALSDEESSLLKAWIQAGAPFEAGETPGPVVPEPAPPSSDPVVPPQEDGSDPGIPGEPAPAPPVAESKLSYEFVKREVFAPKCIGCHGSDGGVNLQSYDNVKKAIKAIHRAAIVERSMPLNDSLTPRQYQILKKWIAMGAPKGGGSGSNPPPGGGSPPGSGDDGSDGANPEPHPHPQPEPAPGPEPEPHPEPEPLKPTYDSIRSRILVPQCLNCHSQGGQAARLPLATKEDLLNSPMELVIPGNVEESSIVIAIERQDSKRMPPPQTGDGLKQEEIQIIKEWIQNGAKD